MSASTSSGHTATMLTAT